MTFDGLRVLLLESRRATEMASLITASGGRPLVAPALREDTPAFRIARRSRQ
jgi:uroporphyrinogen-III synthase